MNHKALAGILAVSLTRGAWDRATVRDRLQQRLPVAIRNLATPIADDLIAAMPGPYAPQPRHVAAALVATPGFRKVATHCAKHDVWPAPDLSPPHMAPIPAFTACALPALTTPQALADWLLVDPAQLDYLADPEGRHERHGDMAVNHYHARVVPKRRGGARLIEAPKARLKALQRMLLDGLLSRVPVHDASFGFVAGRSCRDAAQRHAGEDMVISFDLADYFARLGWGRVFGLYRRLGYPAPVARLLSGLCTTCTPPRVRDRMPLAARDDLRVAHLPQGAPTSPMLANVLTFGLDIRLAGLARTLGARYTRYADDLTFSGATTILAPVLNAVPDIVRDAGFALNPAKTRAMPAQTRQSVTGIVVNQHCNVARRDFDQLKAVIHACGNPADPRLRDPAFCATLAGQIGWVRSVNPQRGAKLDRLLNLALERRIEASATVNI
ncbi:reverse transcriptase family protein [Yoonia sp. R2331]|uniref:reverse transcriptase family protein n=1 Tax=Yoonia sp. R2331 TaxID=3237238 RepID=UPI0034E3ABD2